MDSDEQPSEIIMEWQSLFDFWRYTMYVKGSIRQRESELDDTCFETVESLNDHTKEQTIEQTKLTFIR